MVINRPTYKNTVKKTLLDHYKKIFISIKRGGKVLAGLERLEIPDSLVI